MTDELTKRISAISGLELQQVPEEYLKKSCTTVQGNLDGEKVTVRLFQSSAEKNYRNEKESLTTLSLSGLAMAPKIIRDNDKYLVLVLSYVKGVSAGDSFNFSPRFIKRIEPDELINCLTNMKKIKPKLNSDKQQVLKFYQNKYQGITKKWPFDSSIIDNWYAYFDASIKKDIISNSSFTHGDVNPSNILYQDNQITGLIDWELAKYDGYMRDFSYQYYSALNFSLWRNKYLKKMNLGQNDIKQFYFYLLFSLMGDIATWQEMIMTKKHHHFRSKFLSARTLDLLMKRNKNEIDKIVGMKIFS